MRVNFKSQENISDIVLLSDIDNICICHKDKNADGL